MAIIRIKHCKNESGFDALNVDEARLNEWEGEDVNRINDPSWDSRYKYESDLLCQVITENNYKTVLEVGSGPGKLSNLIQSKLPSTLLYHLVDKPHAKAYFDAQKYEGTFFVKDIATDLDVSDLLPKYDLIICNDTLEHLYAPAKIISKFHGLMENNSILFISVPNWRMGHQFIYRGLWDYDNFLYFMYIHKLEPIDVYPAELVTPPYPKLDSEQSMPDELLQSWNFYFQFKKML